MTPEQSAFFRERGYLLLRQALPKNQVRPVREQVLDELGRLKIWASGKSLSAAIRQLPAFQQIARLSGLIKCHDLQSRLATPAIQSAVVSLAGRKVAATQSQLLISLPNQGDWTLSRLNWHTDIAASADLQQVPGIQAFVLIDDLMVHGGATLALAGSHLLDRQGEPGSRIRAILQKGDNLQNELCSLNLSIVEMCGNAGDVYLMDMRVLHTPSINATKRLRMMATTRYLVSDSPPASGMR